VVLVPVAIAGVACAYQLPFREYPGMEYNNFPLPADYRQPTEFIFARLMYPPSPYGMFGMRGGDWRRGYTSWTNDYPRADRHFIRALRRLTRIDVRSVEQPVNLDDGDDIYNWPFLYAEGTMELSEAQTNRLRDYLLRGGFFVIDDFWGSTAWEACAQTMHRLFPDRPIVDLTDNDSVFHAVYNLKDRGPIPGQWSLRSGRTFLFDGDHPYWRGIFDDKGRLMVGIWVNVDTGDSWEWADAPEYPERYSAMGIRIGVNHVVYALSH